MKAGRSGYDAVRLEPGQAERQSMKDDRGTERSLRFALAPWMGLALAKPQEHILHVKSCKCLCLILDTCGFFVMLLLPVDTSGKAAMNQQSPRRPSFSSTILMLLRRSCAVEPPSCLCRILLHEKAVVFPGVLALPRCPTVSMQVICTDQIHTNTDPPPHFEVCKAEAKKAVRMAIAHSKKELNEAS